MPSETVIRDATIEDAAAMRAMIADLARETIGDRQDVLTVEEMRRYGFGDDKSFESIVAVRGGDVVATALYYDEFSTWRGRKGLYILDIYVAPAARGQGLGRRLVAEIAQRAAARGAAYVKLAVDQENHKAVKFYEMLGFAESAHDRVFILAGDAIEAAGGG